MQFKKISLFLILILFIVKLAMADWYSFQLTNNNYAESMSSIDLDTSDIPHFAWCSNDDGDYDIYYLSDTNGTPIKVTNNTTNDLYPRLRIDQAGNAHIAFNGHDGHDSEEYYVNNIGGSFCDPIQVSFTSTNNTSFVPERSCLTIDSTGVAHIAYKYGYYEYGNWDIYYVNNEGGTFGTPIRITDGSKGTSFVRPSMALDIINFVHITFEDGAKILYTNNVSGTFDSLITVSVGATRWHSSVGIDSSNKVHISYSGYHGGVYYINNVSGNFDSTFVLSNSNNMNGITVLEVDCLDNIHIAYIGGDFGKPDSSELYYVNNCTDSFGIPEQITFNSEHTTDISMSLDSVSACHIAFLEGLYGSNYEVWYITNRDCAGISSDSNDFVSNFPPYYSLQNYPNPFNLQTTISYQLPVNADVTIKIYNILGQEVHTLVNENQNAGIYSAIWNGKDNLGQLVTSGIYFYQLKAGNDFSKIKQMMFLK